MASYRQQLEKLDADIRQLKDEDEVGFIRRNILPKGLGGAPPREEVVSAKAKRAKLNRETDRIKDQIEDSEKKLECIERRLAGKDCDSLLDRFSSLSKEIVGKATDIATSITKLLIAIVVKNILLPITFLQYFGQSSSRPVSDGAIVTKVLVIGAGFFQAMPVG